MSKGVNIFNHFNSPKSDGHKIKGDEMLYCPTTQDVSSIRYTSNGILCSQCNKHANL